MSVVEDKNVQRVLEALFKTGFSQSSFMGTKGGSMKFLFSWPPEILDETQYQNVWSVNNPGGLMSVVENISTLVNPIPYWQDIFFPSNNTVEGIYVNVILGARPVIDEDPRSELYKSESGTEVHQVKGKTVGRLQVIASLEKEEPDEDEERVSSLKSVGKILNSIGNGIQSLESIGNIKSEQKRLRPVASIGKSLLKGKTQSVVRALADANALVKKHETSNTGGSRTTYCPSSIRPVNFASPEAAESWPEVSVRTKTEKGEEVNISMKYMRADIERPWMLDYLLSMDGWKIEGQKSGWLSTGDDVVNDGIFPLLPVSLILCRDLQIKSTNGNEYHVKGLQVLARCCKVLPRMAPQQ